MVAAPLPHALLGAFQRVRRRGVPPPVVSGAARGGPLLRRRLPAWLLWLPLLAEGGLAPLAVEEEPGQPRQRRGQWERLRLCMCVRVMFV